MTAVADLKRADHITTRLHSLNDGTRVLLREQTPGDREALAALFAGLSERSRYLRFLSWMPPVLPRRVLDVLSAVDGDDHVGLLAIHETSVIGAARYMRSPRNPQEAELAFTVTDRFQRRGLGGLMAETLVEHAAGRGLHSLTLEMHGENRVALALARRLGAQPRFEDGLMIGRIPLALAAQEAA